MNAAVWYLPALHGPLHLALTAQPKDAANARGTVRLAVHAPRDPNPLFTLPRLAAVDALCDGPPWSWRFEENVFFVPAAGLIAVLPRDRDRLILHRLDVNAALAKSAAEYFFVNSRPPSLVPGKRFEYAIEALSKKGGVSFKLAAGPNGMAITRDGRLTWDVPVGLKEAVTVSVIIDDAAGREMTHTVELTPTAPE